MGAVRGLAGLFTGGAVKEAFDKVLYHLTTLNLYDRDYLKHLIEGDHLGLNYDAGAKYIWKPCLMVI